MPRPGAKDIAVDIISLCVQLDSIILSSRVCVARTAGGRSTERMHVG